MWGTGQQAELSVKKGDPLSLQCETENTRDAKVTWYKDDEPLSAQWHFSKTVINIKEMSAEDFGVYKCKVENFLGVKSGKIKVINGKDVHKKVELPFKEQVSRPHYNKVLQLHKIISKQE